MAKRSSTTSNGSFSKTLSRRTRWLPSWPESRVEKAPSGSRPGCCTEEPATPAITEAERRTWAQERFTRIDDLATRAVPEFHDRQLVETFVDRIEINPDTKTGVVHLMADLEAALLRSSTRVPGGEKG